MWSNLEAAGGTRSQKAVSATEKDSTNQIGVRPQVIRTRGAHPRHRLPFPRRPLAFPRRGGDAGESIEDVSGFLGHSSLGVTTAYLRRLEGEQDRSWT